MKHLKGQQCLFTKSDEDMHWQWSVSETPALKILDVFAVFQDELEANAQRFFLQPVGRNILNIL